MMFAVIAVMATFSVSGQRGGGGAIQSLALELLPTGLLFCLRIPLFQTQRRRQVLAGRLGKELCLDGHSQKAC